jgi:signal transduction histidine kinase
LKVSKARKLLRLIGPYPYNPYLIFLFFFAIFFSRFIPLVSFLPAGPERWRAGGIVIVASTVPGLIFCVGSILLNEFRFWSSESTLLYVLEVAFFQYLNLLYLPFINRRLKAQLGRSNETLIALSPNIFAVSLILVLIALALMHQAERKISDRLNLATKLVTKLESERQGLIHSDEQLRRQTSQFLHDRVQSDLMVVGMKLKSISGRSTPEINEVIEKAISRLEETRSSDLRNIIQILSPNLEAGSLQSALELLFEQYRSSMDIAMHIDDAVEGADSELLLGIFRIVEQSILNSLVHGPASRVQVDVRSAADGALELTIADDGPGTSIDGINVGVGTAVIDSWVDILKGKKEIDSAPGHGYQLEVFIPAR